MTVEAPQLLGKAVPLCVVCQELGAPIWPPSPTSGPRIMALLRHKLATILTHYSSPHYNYLMLDGTHVRSRWALRCMVTVNILVFKVSELAIIIITFIAWHG